MPRSAPAARSLRSLALPGASKILAMAIRLVVFDLDGTLIDSRRDLSDSVNALLVELGAAPLDLDAVTAMVGDGAAMLVRRALAASQLPTDTPGALERFLGHYDERLTVHTKPYAGIPETLSELQSHGLVLAVLTNKPERASTTILERLDLSRWFFQVIGGDTPAGRKPDPAGLLGIAKTARAAPFETLLVGDSAIDLQTSHRAGTAICLARYGFGLHLDGVALRGDEAFIDDPLEVPALVRSFHAGTPDAPAPETSRSHP
jgi:phosphoglycolate phosphatase